MVTRWSAVLLLPALLAGCGERPPPDPGVVIVVSLDDRPETLADLEQYLEANMVVPEEGRSLHGGDEDYVKSRLFDAFVNERLLLAEAQRREIQVSDLEIEASLGLDNGEEQPLGNATWQNARRRLMIEKLLEQIAREQSAVSDDEVRSWIDANASPGAERRVRMRSLMVDSADEAEKLYKDLKRRRLTFDEAGVVQAQDPDRQVSVEVGWDSLSEEVRGVLEGLRPGQVSRPVAQGGGHHLFLVEAWLDGDPSQAELEDRARAELSARRREQAYQALLRHLRDDSKIRVKPRNLPFEYRPETGA